MLIEIHQVQSTSLLREHATSSFNFSWPGRNEKYLALGFMAIGILVISLERKLFSGGLIPFAIGLFELIKYPRRIDRWVKKKSQESIFNKEITFKLMEEELEVLVDERSDRFPYAEMRQCLISETGILFKITTLKYYYISFSSFPTNLDKKETVSFLQKAFSQKQLRMRRG